jgi:hypothetical protein
MDKYTRIQIMIILILSCMFISVMYSMKSNTEHFKEESTYVMCNKMHNTSRKRRIVLMEGLFSQVLCNKIIDEAENYADVNGWTIKRHANYPTTDNAITDEWEVYDDIVTLIENNIYKSIQSVFKIEPENISIADLFVIKYTIGGQSYLKYHEDQGEFSFTVPLNRDFEGGGTTYKKHGINVKGDTGDCVVFGGQNRHKGNAITSGTRYVLAGFLVAHNGVCGMLV